MLTLLAVALFSLFSANAAPQEWPPEAKAYLNALPKKKLTLDLVVGQAVSQADIFLAHKSEAMRAESVEMQVLAAEDFRTSADYKYFDLKTDPINPRFQTIRTTGWQTSVGVQQYFSSGTEISVLGTHGPQKLLYATNPTVDVEQTAVSITLRQSLLSDFFGTAYRSLRRSATGNRKAIEDGMMNLIELSAMDVITQYYQTWLKQQVSKNLLEGKDRKDKLVRILQGQARRRILETADLLQVESLTLSTEADYLNTRQDLQNTWEQLVTILKLPPSLLAVDASDIPLDLDSPEEKSMQLCRDLKFSDLEKNSHAIKQSIESVAAAGEQVKAMESKLRPDLTFDANYTANGVDSSANETFKNVRNRDFPAVTAGVSLSFPLQNRAQKSLYLAAKANYDQLRYRKQVLVTQLEASWGVLCKTLAQKRMSRDKYQQVNQKNKTRVGLENKRFQMGRLRPLEWTQAEEAEAADYLKYQMSEVEVRQVAWEIQRQSGALGDYLKPYL